jgi:hypothetical protein
VAQHFLLSPAAKTLSLAQVFRMSDEQAEVAFRKVRWASTNGEASCPKCGALEPYEYRRETGALCFECCECKAHFSITSGTLFASHKLPLRTYLAAIAIFCNEVKGKSMLAMSRDLGVSYKTAFVLCHKLREAMAVEMKGRTIGGPGKVAEVDGGYFGGYVKPANMKAHRLDRRFSEAQSGKRKSVVIIRERNGKSVPAVFRSEGAALSFIKARIAPGTVVHADFPGPDILQKPLQGRSVGRSARIAAVVIPGAEQGPAVMGLAADIGLGGVMLGVEGVELLVQPIFGRDTV